MLRTAGLQRGHNRIQFVVEAPFTGRQVIEGQIFLYAHNAKMVLSDVDGTITKSDILGHVFTIFGKDWTHASIAELFQGIARQGYQIIYLTSRPLTQYNYTTEYLKTIRQGGLAMPIGPLLMSPDLLISSFKREVVYKTADVNRLPYKGIAPLVKQGL